MEMFWIQYKYSLDAPSSTCTYGNGEQDYKDIKFIYLIEHQY